MTGAAIRASPLSLEVEREIAPQPQNPARWILIPIATVILVAILCGAAVLCAGMVLVLYTGVADRQESPAFTASATLIVAEDGCSVTRSEVEADEPVTGLQWVVRDGAGDEVLARNAEGEYRYHYYRPGSYIVVLQAFDGSKYVEISNRVGIECP